MKHRDNKAEKAKMLGEETITVQCALEQACLSIQHLLPIVSHVEYYQGVLDTISYLQHDLSQVQDIELSLLYPNVQK